MNAHTHANNRLPQLPKVIHERRSPMERIAEVGTIIKRPGGWGGTETGRWFEALGSTCVGGTCARCGKAARAIDLKLTIGKTGDRWEHAHKGDCQ